MEEEKKEKVEETTEKKEKPEKKKRHIIIRIFDIIIWIALFGWMSICVIDYFNVSNEKEPMFCIEKETLKYDDGTVDVCRGAGYVAYHYKRKSYNGYEFGPFWTENRTEKNN